MDGVAFDAELPPPAQILMPTRADEPSVSSPSRLQPLRLCATNGQESLNFRRSQWLATCELARSVGWWPFDARHIRRLEGSVKLGGAVLAVDKRPTAPTGPRPRSLTLRISTPKPGCLTNDLLVPLPTSLLSLSSPTRTMSTTLLESPVPMGAIAASRCSLDADRVGRPRVRGDFDYHQAEGAEPSDIRFSPL